MTMDSRLNSDEGGLTSSDCESRSRSRSAAGRALRHRRTVDVVEADLIAYRPPFHEPPRPPLGRAEAAAAAAGGDVPPSIEVEAATSPDAGVEQRSSPARHREHDIRELRRRLRCQRAQRNYDDEQPQSSTDPDTVETRLDQLARSAPPNTLKRFYGRPA